VVLRNHDAFEPNYLATWGLQQQIWPVAATAPYGRLPWKDHGRFSALEIPIPQSGPVTARLPAGDYTFIAVRQQLEDERVTDATSTRMKSFSMEFKLCWAMQAMGFPLRSFALCLAMPLAFTATAAARVCTLAPPLTKRLFLIAPVKVGDDWSQFVDK